MEIASFTKKIIKLEKGTEGVALPEDFLRRLELTAGSEVEVRLDEKRRWIVLRPMGGDDFIEHFKESMGSMA